MKLAVVGATGLVGQEVLKVLEERKFQFDELYLVASVKSVGQVLRFKNKDYTILSIEECCKLAPDVAIFSAGGGTSLEWAPKFAEMGTIVIDNSSAWRMDPTKKTDRSGNQRSRIKNRRSHYCQSELLYHSNGDGLGSAAR